MVKKKKISAGDRTFHIAVLVIVFLMCVITLYPIYYMLIVSISDGNAVLRGDIRSCRRESISVHIKRY